MAFRIKFSSVTRTYIFEILICRGSSLMNLIKHLTPIVCPGKETQSISIMWRIIAFISVDELDVENKFQKSSQDSTTCVLSSDDFNILDFKQITIRVLPKLFEKQLRFICYRKPIRTKKSQYSQKNYSKMFPINIYWINIFFFFFFFIQCLLQPSKITMFFVAEIYDIITNHKNLDEI